MSKDEGVEEAHRPEEAAGRCALLKGPIIAYNRLSLLQNTQPAPPRVSLPFTADYIDLPNAERLTPYWAPVRYSMNLFEYSAH